MSGAGGFGQDFGGHGSGAASEMPPLVRPPQPVREEPVHPDHDSGNHEPLRSRVLGVDAPAPGELVGVRVAGRVRAFPRRIDSRTLVAPT